MSYEDPDAKSDSEKSQSKDESRKSDDKDDVAEDENMASEKSITKLVELNDELSIKKEKRKALEDDIEDIVTASPPAKIHRMDHFSEETGIINFH